MWFRYGCCICQKINLCVNCRRRLWRKNSIWRCCRSKKICRWWRRLWQLILSKIWWKNGCGGSGSRLLLLLLPSRLNVSLSLSLFSLDLNSKSIMSDAPFKTLLRSSFLPTSISFIKLPITELCASKCWKSLLKKFCASKSLWNKIISDFGSWWHF